MIKISEVIDAIEQSSDNFQEELYRIYFDRAKQDFIYIFKESFNALEDLYDDISEDRDNLDEVFKDVDDEVRLAFEVENVDNYILIDMIIFDSNIVEMYISQLNDSIVARKLEEVFHGRGKFSRFKDLLNNLGILQDYYDFRHLYYKNQAISWCNENNVKYLDE